jgi:hypothetical protein
MLLPSLAVAVVGRSIRVGGLPFVPYGFYSNGVHDASEWRQAATANHNASALPGLGSQQVMVSELALPSAEALHGFNLAAPYNDGLPSAGGGAPRGWATRRAFLDRAAAVGMKVQYALLGAERWSAAELSREVALVKDHPAVFSYYVADEPAGPGSLVTPARLRAVYKIIKQTDPHHPVSMVFTSRPSSPGGYWAANYSDCYDIAMVDPYPIGDCHTWDPEPVPPCGRAVDVVAAIDEVVALHRGSLRSYMDVVDSPCSHVSLAPSDWWA